MLNSACRSSFLMRLPGAVTSRCAVIALRLVLQTERVPCLPIRSWWLCIQTGTAPFFSRPVPVQAAKATSPFWRSIQSDACSRRGKRSDLAADFAAPSGRLFGRVGTPVSADRRHVRKSKGATSKDGGRGQPAPSRSAKGGTGKCILKAPAEGISQRIVAYEVDPQNKLPIVVAPRERPWMQRMPQRFANRCL